MAPVAIDFLGLFGDLLGKILAIVEGVLEQWVDITSYDALGTGWGLTTAGTNFVGEISNLVEKIMQLIEGILEKWFFVYPM